MAVTGIPYREHTDSGLAEVMQKSLSSKIVKEGDKEFLVLKWTCPACGHSSRRSGSFGGDFVALERRGRRRRNEPRKTVDVLRCDCGEAHEGRPDDGRGCGFWALITLVARGG
jgi:hypothetical protein